MKAEGRSLASRRIPPWRDRETGLLSSEWNGWERPRVHKWAAVQGILGHHEPFLSLSRPERPVARPTARQSQSSVRRREYTRVSVPSPCREVDLTQRCVRDRRLSFGTNTEAQVARRKRAEAETSGEEGYTYNMRFLCVAIAIASVAFLSTIVSGETRCSECSGQDSAKDRKEREVLR